MRIHGDVWAAGHETTPTLWGEAERVVHNVLPRGCPPFHNEVAFPVEILENIQGRELPGLIDRLETKNGRVRVVSVHNRGDHAKGHGNVLPVDARIEPGAVEGADPPGAPNGPVHKGHGLDGLGRQDGCPHQGAGLPRVIESILAPDYAVQVQQHTQLVLGRLVQKPVDLVQSPICAAHIGPIGLIHPVPNRKPQRIDPRCRELIDDGFSDPGVPVSPELLVPFFRAKHLTERVHVHRRVFLVGAEKLVE
mmetsp:Transcript_28529/g.83444  ORF Transcript_28529/g.83444 Transcript_28529/m.83444 type:complete len:250 (-) Transcript_28529:301-1050(-)